MITKHKIGIIGSGTVAKHLALGFVKLGFEVKIGSRTPEKLTEWIKSASSLLTLGSLEETARFGEILILATKWEGTENAINLAGKENFKDKILIDVTNPLDFSKGMPPSLSASYGNSGGDQVQLLLPKAKVVKAFNIISSTRMCNPKLEEGVADLFIAGNDESAKVFATELARAWGWTNIYDIGDLNQSFWLESLAMLWIIFGVKNATWTHGFKLIQK